MKTENGELKTNFPFFVIRFPFQWQAFCCFSLETQNPVIMDYLLLIVTFVGALISELLSIYADMIGCKTFLMKLIPNKSERFYFIIDALLMPVIGTALAYFIMEPESMKTAFCAGLTWCGTLQTLGLTLKSETTTTIKESGGKTTVSSTTKTTKKV